MPRNACLQKGKESGRTPLTVSSWYCFDHQEAVEKDTLKGHKLSLLVTHTKVVKRHVVERQDGCKLYLAVEGRSMGTLIRHLAPAILFYD